MEKRLGSILFILLILVLSATLVLSQDTLSEEEKVSEAYQCLEDQVIGNCEDLSLQEKTFSLLSLNQCQSSLISDSENSGECWPSGDCSIKETAQALFALDNTNGQTSLAKNWLLSHNETPSEIAWYLEMETPGSATCQISYSDSSYTVNINEDKTLSNNAGSCLSLSEGDYWLRVSPSCFDEEFSVSCNQDFLTTTLFQEIGESTIHVMGESSSAAAGGTTKEKIDSYCFADPGSSKCDYEGSLWAALILNSLGEEVNDYLPYLIVQADEHERFLPEAFLYMLTGNEDYRDSLLSKQKSSKYWQESGDEYFDTALALLPFQSESPSEKENSKEWLLDSQNENGCWQGGVRNTGFILASIWPQSFGGGGTGGVDCEDAGYYCTPSASCSGEIVNEYSCSSSLSVCCSEPQEFQTCSELGGEICSSNQVCRGGEETNTGDLSGSEICCVDGGSCEIIAEQPENECEAEDGVCRFTCETGERESSLDCSTSGAVCCIFEGAEEDTGGSLWWIGILLVLIILTGLGIYYRDKLREWLLKLKSKFGKGRGSSSGSGSGPRPRGPPRGFPRRPSRHTPIRPPERRILLPKEQPKPGPKPKRPGSKELDDVLKKLKEMSE